MFRWRKRFKPGVTAAIPTCGRPAKLRKCVEACLADGLVDRVLVWNSAPNPCEQLSRLAVEFPTLSVIEAGRLTGPSEARQQLAKRAETEFLFFSDDSKYADDGAIAEMMRLMRLHNDIDILLGALRNINDGKWLDLAQHIEFGRLDKERTVRSPAIHGEVGGSAGRSDRRTAAMTGRVVPVEFSASRYRTPAPVERLGMMSRSREVRRYRPI